MSRLMKKNSEKAGLPPGTLMYVGEKRTDTVTVDVLDYNETEVHEKRVDQVDDCLKYMNSSSVTWINVTGLHDMDLLRHLGDVFGIHPLLLEDVVSISQRPKMEDHDDYLFVAMKMLYRSPKDNEVVAEQISLILGKNYVLSFQEMEGDVFDVIRDRIRTGKGRIRKMDCDYLAYCLIDAIVDNYFVVIENAADRIEDLQEAVIGNAESETLQAIHLLKREMIFLRKNLWPLREVVSNLEKCESRLLKKSIRPYLRDVYEHTIQVIDNVETLRDGLSGVLDIYMTTVSNRMNEVMKVLTIIATIFIPLTFIVGVYGMNFEVMPELKWKYGYAAVWCTMIAIGIGMLVFFKRKKWL